MIQDRAIELKFVTMEMIIPPDESAMFPPEPYWVVNLAKLTPRWLGLNLPTWTLQPGQWKDFYASYDSVQEKIPWGVFANWIQGRKSDYWYPTGERQFSAEIRAAKLAADAIRHHRVLSWFRREPLNKESSVYLEPESDTEDWWYVPTHIPAGEEFAGEEICLAIAAENEELAPFAEYHSRTLVAVKEQLIEDEVAELRSTLGAAVRGLEEAITKHEEELGTPLGKLLQKLQSGDALFQMVVDFAKPKDWRDDNLKGAFAKLDYVVPDPSGTQRDLVNKLWKRWRNDLTHNCAQLIVESRGLGDVDSAANNVLEHLRDPAGAVFQMFEQWDTLFEASRAELVQITVKGLRLALRGTETRRKILKGEFAEIAVAAGGRGDAVGPEVLAPLLSSARDQLIQDAVNNMDVAAMFHDTDQTPLGQFVADKLKKGTAAATHGAVALDVLALATPYVARVLRASDPSGANATAWLWRSAVGAGRLSSKGQRQFWEELQTLVWEGKLPKISRAKNQPIRLVTKGKISATVGSLGAAFKAVNVLASCILIYEAGERQKHKEYKVGVKDFMNLMGLAKDTAELAASPILHKLLTSSTKEADLLTKSITGTKIVPVLGIAVDALALAISIQELHSSKTWSTKKRESLVDNAMLDGLALVVSILGLALGAEFVVLGVLIFVVKELLQNPDSWLHVFPSIGAKTKTHLYLQGLLQSLTQEKDPSDPDKQRENPFRKTLGVFSRSPRGVALGGRRLDLHNRVIEHLELYEAPVAADNPTLWEIGGEAGRHISVRAVTYAHGHYGFPRSVAKKIVGPS